MPLNVKPRKDEGQDKFISRCVSYVSKADPDRPSKQVQAICYDIWKRAKGQKTGEGLTVTNKMVFFDDDSLGFDALGGAGFYRKQVLRFGTFRHPDDENVEFDITPEVAKQIVENFNRGIPDEAPVILTHTQDPRMKVGTVKWFEVGSDGIYAILSVADKAMVDKIENDETSPGVSVWLDLDYRHKETNEEVGAVVKHVALVNNPYIEELTGFEQVDFSEDAGYLPLLLSESKTFKAGENLMDKKRKSDNELTKEKALKFLKEKENLDVEVLLSDKEELVDLHKKIEDGVLIDKKDAEKALSEDLVDKIKSELKLSEEDVKDKKVSEVIKGMITKHTELSEKVKSLEDNISKMEADKRVQALLSEGFIYPKEAEPLKNLYLKDKDLFKSMEKAKRGEKPVIELGEKGARTPEEGGDDDKDQDEIIKRNIEAAEQEGYVAKTK